MINVVKHNDKHLKEFYKLYCEAHNITVDYNSRYTDIKKYIPGINNIKINLLKINDKIQGYIFYKDTLWGGHKERLLIEDIFIRRNYNISSNYTILIESTNRNVIFKPYKYAEIYSDRIPRIEDVISKLNLKLDRKLYSMDVYLNRARDIQISDSICFTHFKNGLDELKRVTIQNSIFRNAKGHIDCRVNDILYEENQDYYMEDGCIFLNINNRTAGYSQIILESYPVRRPYIVNFGIDTPFRGIGLSKLLLNYTLNFIKLKGFNEAYVTVDAANHRAYNLYRKAGFNRICTLVFYLYKYRC